MTDEEFDELWTSCDWRTEIDNLRAKVAELKKKIEALLYQYNP